MNNVKPRSRYERDSQNYRDIIEKNLINSRGGYEARHIDAQKLIYGADIKSSLYCAENDRFDKDFNNIEK